EAQRLETEARPVQVHVASDPPVFSSTSAEVDPAPNGVAAEQKEVAEERIVAAVNIIAEQQHDGDVAIGNVLSDAMIPATHQL
ncbi:hypothetical protein A2U01_0089654, partial [Trifolium medium]|nr:hypothetical protein [Trifolium medium]